MWYLVVGLFGLGAGLYIGYEWGARAVAEAKYLAVTAQQEEAKVRNIFSK